MLFNPVIYIGLAAISLLLGILALIDTDNLWVMTPFIIFMLLFFVSLLRNPKS